MKKSRPIRRTTAERMIETENYKKVLDYVTGCFQNIHVYYKRRGKDYFIILYEHTNETWSNFRIHCDLTNFLEEMDSYDGCNVSSNEDDINFIMEKRPDLSKDAVSSLDSVRCRLIRCSIEDEDSSLESALVDVTMKDIDERYLYNEWNMAGFSWSGYFYRDKEGMYHVTEYDPDWEETGGEEYLYFDFSPEEMVDYAVSHEEYGDYGWGHDLKEDELEEAIQILDLCIDDIRQMPRSLSFNVLKYAKDYDDKVLISYARKLFLGEEEE